MKNFERPKLLIPSYQILAFFWPWVLLLALIIWQPEMWVLGLGAGFFLGYLWAYLRIFKHMDQVFGRETANKIWVIFRGY